MAQDFFYKWNPETPFELKGQELQDLLYYVNSKLMTQEAREIIHLYEMKKFLDAKIEAGLKTGKVVVQNIPPDSIAEDSKEKE